MVMDPVNDPEHYRLASGLQCIDVIHQLDLNYHRGSAFAYLWRAGRKSGSDELEDLKKCRWYLDREIERLGQISTANSTSTRDEYFVGTNLPAPVIPERCGCRDCRRDTP